jgi:TatD DNase family protein
MWVDSHCHLDRIDLTPYENDLGKALQAAEACGISHILNISIDMSNVETVVNIAQQFDHVFAAVGVHPSNQEGEQPSLATLIDLAGQDKVIAIGETGLDYFYNKELDYQQTQRLSFVKHLQASKVTRKPTIIHTREAKQDTLDTIKQEGDIEVGGIMHCFTEDWEMAKQALDLNYYISISGIVTFKNADNVQAVAKKVPLDRLLVETDAPYLAPIPYRGKKNEPKYVREVGEFVAQLRGMTSEALALATSQNFFTLFHLNK